MSKTPQKKQVTYSASQARENFYGILKDASMGLQTYEVTQRSGESVVIMSKEDFEGWQETLDIMSNPDEYAAILRSGKQKKLYTHEEVWGESDV